MQKTISPKKQIISALRAAGVKQNQSWREYNWAKNEVLLKMDLAQRGITYEQALRILQDYVGV